MRNQSSKRVGLSLCAAALAAAKLSSAAHAAVPVVDGTLDAAYGAPLSVQTNNTAFGKNTDGTGVSNGGSELDAAYGLQANGNLYLFFAGNLETNYNHLNIYLADGRAGQSTLNVAAGQTLAGLNGSKFAPGFSATYALDVNGGGGPPVTEYVNSYDLTQSPAPGNYIGSFNPGTNTSTGVATTLTSGVTAAANLSNVAGVGFDTTVAASASNASSVTTGFEIAIPLSVLGSPKGAIKVLADVVGSGDQYYSNQFLPGLAAPQGNPGGNTFDFSSTPGAYFTVAAAASTNNVATWTPATGGSWAAAANWSTGKIPNAAGDSATFGPSITTASTVTLDGSKTVGSLTFNSPVSYTIAPGTGGTLTINDAGDSTGVNPLVSVRAGSHSITAPVALAAGVTVSTAASSQVTFAGVVSGAGPITLTGPGTIVLAAANTYSGNTTALAGTVQLNAAAGASAGTIALGDATADFVPATLAIGTAGLTIANPIVTNQDDAGGNSFRVISSTPATGTTTLTGGIQVNGGLTLNVATGGALVVSAPIVNGNQSAANGNTNVKFDLIVNAAPPTGGTAANASAGSVLLSAANTYTGSTTVNAGTLTLGPAGSLASTSLAASNGGSFSISGAVSQNADVTSAGLVTFQPNSLLGSGYLPRVLDSLTIAAGGRVLLAPAAIAANRTVLVTPGLTIANASAGTGPGGQLDTGTNDVVIQGPDPTVILPLVTAGYNGGTFTGQGITSSAAAANVKRNTTVGAILNADNNGNAVYASTFDGQGVSPFDVLIKYTYYGDANLDGQVNGTDYARIDAGFLSQRTASPLTGWYNGDFNYDGKVDASDYTLIDNAFNTQGGRLSSSAALTPSITAASTDEVAPTAGTTAVPEPTTVVVTAAAAAALLGRRRRTA